MNRRAARWFIVSVLMLALMGSLVAGCKKSGVASDKPVVGGAYSVAMVEEPKTLNPLRASAAVEDIILNDIQSPLVYVDFDGKFAPGLATEWQTSEDGKSWTFKIRDDVFFHCGEKMTAADIAWTWNKALAEPGPMMTEFFVGVKKAEATDATTLQVTFEDPNGGFLSQLRDGGMTGPMCQTCFEKLGADGYAKHPCGTGAYKFEEWKTGESLSIVRFDKWNWGPSWVHQGPSYIERFRYKIIPDQATRLAAFESGELTATGIPGQFWSKYETDDRFYTMKGMSNFVAYLVLNQTKFPLDDINVRKAIGYALDRNAEVQMILEGRGKPAYNVVNPKLQGYDKKWETDGYKYDQAKAASLLEESGWKDTNGDGIREKNGKKLKFEIWTMPSGKWGVIADLIKTQLKEVGFECNITSLEFNTLTEYMVQNKHQMVTYGYSWDGDPLQILRMLLHSTQIDGGLNYARYNSKTMDTLIDDGRTQMDQNARLAAVAAVQAQVMEDAVYIPIHYEEYLTAVSKDVQGIKMHPFFGSMILEDAWIAEKK